MGEPRSVFDGLARLYTGLEDRLYYELAPAYDAVSWLVSLGHWAKWRRLALDDVAGQRVLEVGFGTGELLIEMARRGVWATRVRGVAQAMPFAESSFDTLIATFPADFIFDPATVREAARLLTSGGRFIVVDMCLYTDSNLLRRAARWVGILTEPVLGAYEQAAAAAAGLRVTVNALPGKGLRVLVIVAVRPPHSFPRTRARSAHVGEWG